MLFYSAHSPEVPFVRVNSELSRGVCENQHIGGPTVGSQAYLLVCVSRGGRGGGGGGATSK